MSMLKWKLMITTLPVPLVAILIRYILEHFFKNYMNNYSGVMDFSALSPVLTGGVFLIGLMLSGTLQDYKESEKIPAELATCLETIEETVTWVCANRPAVNERQMKELVAEVTDEVIGWLLRKRTPEQGFVAIEKLNGLVKEFDKLNAGLPAVRMMTEIHNLRRTMTRIGVISRTGFLASGYALLDILVVSVLTLLIIASYKAEFGVLGKYIIIGFVSLIYSYLWRLVKDVDDPFEYAPDGERTGAAEVELFPILEYQARAKERLAGKTIEQRFAEGVAKADSGESSGPSLVVLAGVSIGCLCIGASVVWLLSRGMNPPPNTAPIPLPAATATPATVAPPVDAAKPAPKAVEIKDAAPTPPPAAKAAAPADDTSKPSVDDEPSDEEASKKPKRRHHRRKKE